VACGWMRDHCGVDPDDATSTPTPTVDPAELAELEAAMSAAMSADDEDDESCDVCGHPSSAALAVPCNGCGSMMCARCALMDGGCRTCFDARLLDPPGSESEHCSSSGTSEASDIEPPDDSDAENSGHELY
jgi:hypothetical protein